MPSGTSSVLVPVGVWRPAMTLRALRRGPLMQAGRTDAAGLEGIPNVAASAGPEILFAGRPAAERTTYARTGGFCAFVLARRDLGPGFRHGSARAYRQRAPLCSIRQKAALWGYGSGAVSVAIAGVSSSSAVSSLLNASTASPSRPFWPMTSRLSAARYA